MVGFNFFCLPFSLPLFVGLGLGLSFHQRGRGLVPFVPFFRLAYPVTHIDYS